MGHAIAGDHIFDYIDKMDPSTICMNFGACPPVMQTRVQVSQRLLRPQLPEVCYLFEAAAPNGVHA
jgi:hypothetical protein